MSLRVNVGIAAIAIVALASGCYYWLHGRANQPPTAIASETPKTITRPTAAETTSVPPAQPEFTAKAQPEPPLAATPKKDPVTTSGLPLRPGEILDFIAD